MIPKDILQYPLDAWLFSRYRDGYYASCMAKLKQPVYLYSYSEDSCYRVENGLFYKKFRGENAELIPQARENELIAEYRINPQKYDDEIGEKKTVVISKKEYDKFGTSFTPWCKALYRLLFEECTEDPKSINYTALTDLFYEDKETPPVVVLNDAREILGLPKLPIPKSEKQ